MIDIEEAKPDFKTAVDDAREGGDFDYNPRDDPAFLGSAMIKSKGQFVSLLGNAAEYAFHTVTSSQSVKVKQKIPEDFDYESLQIFRANTPIRFFVNGLEVLTIKQGMVFAYHQIPSRASVYCAIKHNKPKRRCSNSLCRAYFKPKKRTCSECGSVDFNKETHDWLWIIETLEDRGVILKKLLTLPASVVSSNLQDYSIKGKRLCQKLFVDRRCYDGLSIQSDGRLMIDEVKSTSMEELSRSQIKTVFFYVVLTRLLQQEHGLLTDVRTDCVRLVYYGRNLEVSEEFQEQNVYKHLENQYQVKIDFVPLAKLCRESSNPISAVVISYGPGGYSYRTVPASDTGGDFTIKVDSVNEHVDAWWGSRSKKDDRLVAIEGVDEND